MIIFDYYLLEKIKNYNADKIQSFTKNLLYFTELNKCTGLCFISSTQLKQSIIFFQKQKRSMIKTKAAFILSCIFTLSIAQNFNVSLDQAVLLHEDSANIKTIGKDLEGNFFVGFTNGQARRYSPDFTSYINLTLPEPVDQFNTRATSSSATLSNGSYVSLGDRRMVAKSGNFTIVRDYDYYTFVNSENYIVNDTILSEHGFPIKVSSVSYTFHILICQNTILLAFRGSVMTVLSHKSYFNINAICKTATNYQYTLGTSGDYYTGNFTYYVGFSNGNVYFVTVNVAFKFNFTANHYDYNSITVTNTAAFSAPSAISSLYITNGLLLMQSNSTGYLYLYNLNTKALGTVIGIPYDQLFNFFYIYGAYYVLLSTGLIKASYNTTSNVLSLGSLMSQLPNNTYGLNFGSTVDPFFIPGQPYLYKAGACVGNSKMQGSSCVSYSCTASNCAGCPVSPALCSTCSNGYTLNGSSCVLTSSINNSSNTNNTSNTNNSSGSSNNTSNTNNSSGSSNSTSNTTNNTSAGNNTSNTGNTTSNGNSSSNTNNNNTSKGNTTSNSSNINNNSSSNTSNGSNTNNTSNTSNTSDTAIDNSYQLLGMFNQQFLQDFFNILKLLISIPAARRVITPAFYYFGVFDDIYLFQFHDRLYGNTMNRVFFIINDIQSKKWSLINYQEVLAWINEDLDQFQNRTDYQDAYDYYPFTDANHTNVGPQGLWANCQNFFVVSMPITVFCFLLFRKLFQMLFQHPVSRWIRKFQFWPLLLLLLLDGNIQQFAFYQMTDWKNMFAFNYTSKLIKVHTIFFGFGVFVSSFALYFLSYSFYSRLNRYIMDNNRNIVSGHTSLIVQIGIKNLCLGLMHSMLRPLPYKIMLSLLLGWEIAFNLGFIISVKHEIYISKLKIWIYLILNFIKISLIITFFLDYQNINTPLIEDLQQFLVLLQMSMYCVGVFCETLMVLREIILELPKICQNKSDGSTKKKKAEYLRKALSYKGTTVFFADIQLNSLDQNQKDSHKNTTYSQLKSKQTTKKYLRSTTGLKSKNITVKKSAHKMTFKIKMEEDVSFS